MADLEHTLEMDVAVEMSEWEPVSRRKQVARLRHAYGGGKKEGDLNVGVLSTRIVLFCVCHHVCRHLFNAPENLACADFNAPFEYFHVNAGSLLSKLQGLKARQEADWEPIATALQTSNRLAYNEAVRRR